AIDELGCRLLTDGPQQFILNDLEKFNGFFIVRIIVDAGSIDVFYFLVKEPLRQAYLPNAFLQFGEVVHGTARLKALIIQGKAFNDVFFEALRSPDAELRALWGFYAVTHRDDDIEVVMLKFPFN